VVVVVEAGTVVVVELVVVVVVELVAGTVVVVVSALAGTASIRGTSMRAATRRFT
jgi:hypothetical protein